MNELAIFRVTGFPRLRSDHSAIEVAARSEADARAIVARASPVAGRPCAPEELKVIATSGKAP